jgi:hypothetical protein
MVTPVKSWQFLMANGRNKGRVVEIIGPAGAGKSTLYEALGALGPGLIREPLPPVRNISYFLFFVKNIISLFPILIHLPGKSDRLLTREELAWMAMLNGWPKLLKQQTINSHNVILLDQGPIFLIGTLHGFGPSGLQNFELQGWWEKIFERWREVLDIIIWLDSSDEILTMRIRKREQGHDVKEASDQEVHEFLAKWRRIFDQTMSRISLNNPKIQVIRIDTGRYSVEEIVCKVIEITHLQ